MKRGLMAATAVAGMLVGVTACGSGGGTKTGADGFKGQKLTVWVMNGSNPAQWTEQVSAQFKKTTGATVEFKVQQWNGIQQKLSTALSEDTPPDVVEIGNTQTAAYAKAGALAEVGDLKKEIGADWNDAFNKASLVDGKQYALPWFAGNRVVMYNKKIWAEAGLKGAPGPAVSSSRPLPPSRRRPTPSRCISPARTGTSSTVSPSAPAPTW